MVVQSLQLYLLLSTNQGLVFPDKRNKDNCVSLAKRPKLGEQIRLWIFKLGLSKCPLKYKCILILNNYTLNASFSFQTNDE